LTLALCLTKRAGEMAREHHVYRHIVTGDDHLFHLNPEIRYGCAELM
jgi:hypothetical protein